MTTTPRIFIGVAATGNCKTAFAMSKDALIAYFPSEKLSPEVEHQEITSSWSQSSGLCHNYHQLVLAAQRWKATHLLTIEEDMGFRPEVLHTLYRKHQLWVGCNYPMKSVMPWQFTACALNHSQRVITHEGSSGLESCCYTGMGVTLFDMTLFDRVEKPWFVMDYLGDDNYATQDAYFGDKVRKAGIEIFVDHDASKLVWHVGDFDYNWLACVRGMQQQAEIDRKKKEAENGQ